MGTAMSFGIIIALSVVLYYAGKYFTVSSSRLGDYLHIPRSVKGATLDAISSSLPEFLIALFSVLAFSHFDVGIGTIIGSALFNVLVIPGLCILVAPKPFKIGLDVTLRDGLFYLITVSVLIGIILTTSVWTILIPLILIGMYIVYARRFIRDTNTHRITVEQKKEARQIKVGKEVGTFIFTIAVTAIACYYLVEHAILFAEGIGVHPIIVSFTIIAAASSVPDTIISFLNAKKGDLDDATSNVYGSNIFDICIGLGIPALLAILLYGPLQLTFEYTGMAIGLLILTAIATYTMARPKPLPKSMGLGFLALYGLFVIYTVWLTNGSLTLT